MNKKNIFLVIILFLILSITVGFSAFASEMSIGKIVADVRIEKNVRITGVEIISDRSSNIVVNEVDYDVDSVISNISFNDTSSYVVYKITLTNFGNARAGVYNAVFDAGYSYEVLDSAYGSVICDSNGKCNLGASTDVILKVYPTSHSTGNHSFKFDFDIRQYYTVSYKNVDGSPLTNEFIGGEGFIASFSEPYPTSVKVYTNGELVESNKYIYNNGTLEYYSIYGDVLVVGEYKYTYEYMGNYQEFVTPVTGNYMIELWGAQGGHETEDSDIYVGAYGGYTKGNIQLTKGTKLYVYVGEQPVGKGQAGGYNGGGTTSYDGSGGGGATDIRLDNSGVLDFNSLKSRIMVAAGGGGGYDADNHGGGGLIGYTRGDYSDGKGGTQTAGGAGGDSTVHNTTCVYGNPGSPANGLAENGSFGRGGNANYLATGGGSGYYGGGSGTFMCIKDGGGAGGGGSSFISGHDGCDAISESSTESSIIHTGQSIHYSGYQFSDTVIIDSAGYKWSTTKGDYVGMPTHDGKSTMVGNSGSGYAKITLVELN